MKQLSIALAILLAATLSTTNLRAQQTQSVDVHSYIGDDNTHEGYDRLLFELSSNTEMRDQPG